MSLLIPSVDVTFHTLALSCGESVDIPRTTRSRFSLPNLRSPTHFDGDKFPHRTGVGTPAPPSWHPVVHEEMDKKDREARPTENRVASLA
jgi:hypothetical protein